MKSTITLLAMFVSLNAFAGGGGDGGKIQADWDMDAATITQYLAKSKDPAYYTFQALEFMWQGADPKYTVATDVNKKLFAGQPTVYQALQGTTLIPTNDVHACDGLPEKDPDACAFPDSKKIYFIIPRIQAEGIKFQTGSLQILALVVHEAVHLIKGTTEEEAVLVQTQMQSMLSSSVYQAFPQVPDHIKGALTNAYLKALTAQANFGKSQDNFCNNLQMSYMQMSEATTTDVETHNTTGLQIIPTKQDWNLNAAALKMLNLMVVCGINEPDPRADALFKTRTIVSLLEYAKAKSTPDTFWDGLPNLQIRRVSPGANAAISAEMNDILGLFKQAVDGTK